jgi:cell division protein FtsB
MPASASPLTSKLTHHIFLRSAYAALLDAFRRLPRVLLLAIQSGGVMPAFVRAAQKFLVAMALPFLFGTVAYQAHQNSVLRRQIEAIQQQQAPLAEHNQFLETELSNLTNQLADANQRFQRDTTDLLRLRAENARLKSIGGQKAMVSQTVVQETVATEAASPDASLNEEEKHYLQEMAVNIKTKNSAADIDRLRDTLARWDELVTTIVPPKMAAVIPALKQLVAERVTELEKEAVKN